MPFFFNSKLRANILFLIKLKFQIRSYCTTSATKVRQEGKIKISLRVFGEGRKPKGYDRLGEPTPLTPCSLENVPFLSRGKLWGSGESLNSISKLGFHFVLSCWWFFFFSFKWSTIGSWNPEFFLLWNHPTVTCKFLVSQ